MSSTENTNPGKFANRPAEEVKEIASMGGKASHGTHKDSHAEGHEERKDSTTEPGRNLDGTFTKGSEAAKKAGHMGGLRSHDHDGSTKEGGHAGDESVSEVEVQDDDHAGRNPDGTFKKGSEAAKEAGHKGGSA